MNATACSVASLTAQTEAIGFQGNCRPSPPRNGSARVQATAKASACAVDRAPAAQRHQGGGEADGQREEQGEAQHRRHGVGAEALGIGEEGDADPVEPGEEEAEAERRAAHECPAGPGPVPCSTAIRTPKPASAGSRVERRQGCRGHGTSEQRGERGMPFEPGSHASGGTGSDVQRVSRPAAGDGCARA